MENFCTRMVYRSAPASRTKFYLALRLPTLVVSKRKYRHIVLKETNYKKLKSYQFLFEGNIKRLQSKIHEGKTYVEASVLPSVRKTPYRVVVELTPRCDVLRATSTYPAGLGSLGKGKCNHVWPGRFYKMTFMATP